MGRANRSGGQNAALYAMGLGVFIVCFIVGHRQLRPPALPLEVEGEAIAKNLKAWAAKSGLDVPSALRRLELAAPVPQCPKVTCPTCDTAASSNAVATIVDDEIDPELKEMLGKIANDKNEVMIALANGVMICKNTSICWWNGGNILHTWLEMVKAQNIQNLAIGVLDDETWTYLNAHFPDVVKFRPKMHVPSSQLDSHPANRVSTLKYGLIKDILLLGYHVLVVDMDLVFTDNPFNHLYRDSDLESQTDGFNDMSYGTLGSVHDPTMGWGAGGLYTQIFTLNVGCLYVRASAGTVDLMTRVNQRLFTSKGWDQQVFNEEVFMLAHGDVTKAHVSVRVMDHMLFANSKTFFRSERRRFIPGATATLKPLMVHMNYHPDKHKRMLCLIERYYHGKLDACDSMPGGSEPGT